MALTPFIPDAATPWNRRRALHLLRRTGFGGDAARVNEFLALTPSDAVDRIVDHCLVTPAFARPVWADIGRPAPGSSQAVLTAYTAQRAAYVAEFRRDLTGTILRNGLHGRLTLFWHSHFATEILDYGNMPQYAWRYIRVIQSHLAGDFKRMVHDVGLTPAMLIYLNGNLNRRTLPNENYARELLELYTLGEGNAYTQTDITELSKALTGYTTNDQTMQVAFSTTHYDNWFKTIFGVRENFNYTMAVDHLFAARPQQVARHICRKLHAHFVHPDAPAEVIEAMAAVFLANAFRVEPVLRMLLKSRHFFDEAHIGALVKSPYELFGGLMSTLAKSDIYTTTDYATILAGSVETGFNILAPPDVGGWPGHRTWLDTSRLPIRWSRTETFLGRFSSSIMAFARTMPDPNDPFALAADLAEYLTPMRVGPDERQALGLVLLAGTPAYEWSINATGATNRVLGYIRHLLQLPEFQLT